jgi:hypothetical protein
MLVIRERTVKAAVCYPPAVTYRPVPVDTAGVSLSEDLNALTERLAEHAHDLWAERRVSEGWTYGPTRNDTAKTHPCLVPYADLPEQEKEYDRSAAMGTLKAIVALGYRIVPAATRRTS